MFSFGMILYRFNRENQETGFLYWVPVVNTSDYFKSTVIVTLRDLTIKVDTEALSRPAKNKLHTICGI